jgi:calcium permeable stress-gated cation channel
LLTVFPHGAPFEQAKNAAGDMTDTASLGLAYTLGGSLLWFLFAVLLFEFLRRRLPNLYYWRNLANTYPEYASKSGKPLGCAPYPGQFWPSFVLSYPHARIEETHGLDIAMYLRFLATQVRIFALLTIITFITLLPTYGTATNKKLSIGAPDRTVGVQILSLSNVSPRDSRLWITFFVDIVVVIIFCFMIYKEIASYSHRRRRYRSRPSPANYVVLVMDIPRESRSQEAVRAMFECLFPGEVHAVHMVRNASKLLRIKDKCLNAFEKREKALLLEADVSRTQKTHAGCCGMFSKPKDAKYWANLEAELYRKARMADEDADFSGLAPTTHAAFVVFKTRRAASFASEAQVWKSNSAWKISRAPDPEDVNWNSIPISSRFSSIRRHAVIIVILGFTVLWFVPITAVQALSNFSALSNVGGLKFLASFRNSYPRLASFAEGILPPLLLFLLNVLVPVIFRFLLSFSRVRSLSHMDAKIRNFLFVFYGGINFLANALVGSVFSALATLLDDPKTSQVVSLLSSTVPKQATFFMKYVLLNTFLGSALGLLNVGRLIFRPFFVMGFKTERQQRKSNSAMSDFPVFKLYAIGMMVSLVCIVYSTIAPLICIIATCYFGTVYMCMKHTLMYGDMHLYDGGGYLFRGACSGLLVGVYIHQLILAGVFYLKSSFVLAILENLCFFATIAFTLYVRRRFRPLMKHGSLIDQYEADEEAGFDDIVQANYADYYVHPGLKPIQDHEFLGKENVEISPSKT